MDPRRLREMLMLLLTTAVLSVGAKTKQIDTNLHIYLLLGQSNMAGRGNLDAISNETDPGILALNKENQWVIAKDPIHFDKPSAAGVGPGISFAKEMKKSNNKIKIGLVPCAVGGSPIKVWQSGAVYLQTFRPYDDALMRVRFAMTRGILKGIIWHQGESDNDSTKSKVYLEKLVHLVNSLRKDLNMANLPFVAGEIGYFNRQNLINERLNMLSRHLHNIRIVSANDLIDKGDRLHFDAKSARTLGIRYAQAMKKLLLPCQIVLTFDDAELSHYSTVAPLLKKYNFNATFFICEFPLKRAGDSTLYMSWSQIKALHDLGFEIGNHTGHHKDLTKLSETQIREEVEYIERKCNLFNIPKPVSFSYPGNRSDSVSRGVLKTMAYKFARAGGSRYFEGNLEDLLTLPSFTLGSSAKLRERAIKALDELQPGNTLIFTIHGVPDTGQPDYSTSPAFLEEILQKIKNRGYRVIALNELGYN